MPRTQRRGQRHAVHALHHHVQQKDVERPARAMAANSAAALS